MNNLSYKEKLLFDISKLNDNEVLKKFDSSLEGLKQDEVDKRLKKYGYNKITERKKENWLSRLFSSLKNPLIILLMLLIIISYLINEHETAIIIFIMVLISTILSFLQESNADRAAQKLQEMVSLTTTVIRQSEKTISIKNIVVGDIIKLSAGHIIPADIRILESNNLYINQSSLTGESLPVEKKSKKQDQNITNILEIPNICLMGSYVASGTALGIVAATGENTYWGELSLKISKKKTKNSL